MKRHGLMIGKHIEVSTANCFKPKASVAEDYLCKPWHHVAVINWNVGIVYVWDTREVVDTIQLSAEDAKNFVLANDNGQDLVVPDKPSRNLLFALQSIQDILDDSDLTY